MKKKGLTFAPGGKSALTEAIENEVQERLKDALEGYVKKEDLPDEVAAIVKAQFESGGLEMCQAAITQMLGIRSKVAKKDAPAAAPAEPADPDGCRHKNFMRKCKSCVAKHAADQK